MPSSDPPTAEEPRKSQAADASQSQKDKKGIAMKQAKEPMTPTETLKLSGAELKKKAKDEKAARRAQALLDKQSSGAVPPPLMASGQTQKSDPQKGPKGPAQKKGGLAAVEPRNLPTRGVQKTATVVELPKEEDKTVEFFRHLYKTRTTSIAGAGKDVHPAVLALGLQMGNYTICGSCARLLATLQAFKRVSPTFSIYREFLVPALLISTFVPSLKTDNYLIGHRVIYHTSWELPHPTSYISCSLSTNRLLILMSASLNIDGKRYSVAQARNIEGRH